MTNLERAEQTLVDAHHCTGVVELSTVVRRGEQRDELPLREELISILHNLMRTADEIHVVLLQETRHDIRTKREANSAVVFAPSGNILVGVGPQEIAKETAVRNLEIQSAPPPTPPAIPSPRAIQK